MDPQMRKVLERKAAERKRLRELPFSEKLKLLEKLRDRSLAIARSPLRAKSPITGNLKLAKELSDRAVPSPLRAKRHPGS